MELFLKHFVTADKATDYLSQEEEVVVMVMTLAVADLKLVELFAARQLSSKSHDLEHPFNSVEPAVGRRRRRKTYRASRKTCETNTSSF